jgi:hypothetical protein
VLWLWLSSMTHSGAAASHPQLLSPAAASLSPSLMNPWKLHTITITNRHKSNPLSSASCCLLPPPQAMYYQSKHYMIALCLAVLQYQSVITSSLASICDFSSSSSPCLLLIYYALTSEPIPGGICWNWIRIPITDQSQIFVPGNPYCFWIIFKRGGMLAAAMYLLQASPWRIIALLVHFLPQVYCSTWIRQPGPTFPTIRFQVEVRPGPNF